MQFLVKFFLSLGTNYGLRVTLLSQMPSILFSEYASGAPFQDLLSTSAMSVALCIVPKKKSEQGQRCCHAMACQVGKHGRRRLLQHLHTGVTGVGASYANLMHACMLKDSFETEESTNQSINVNCSWTLLSAYIYYTVFTNRKSSEFFYLWVFSRLGNSLFSTL